MPEPAASARRSVLIELAVHAIAFCMAAAIGATVLSRYYAIFGHDTDSASAARDAFLTAVVMTGAASVRPSRCCSFDPVASWSGKDNFEIWQNVLDGSANKTHFANYHNVGWL